MRIANYLSLLTIFHDIKIQSDTGKKLELRYFLPVLSIDISLLVPFLGKLVRRGNPLLLHVDQARIVMIAMVIFKVPLVGP